MKQVNSFLFVFILAGFGTSAQVNILLKKDKAATIFTEKKSVTNKKVQQLYPPRFSFYSYPLPPFKSTAGYKHNESVASEIPVEILHVAGVVLNTLFADQLYYRYPTNPAYWTSRY